MTALIDKRFAIWLPSFSMYQCGDWDSLDDYHKAMNEAVLTYTNEEFILCTIFFWCTFMLRNINDEFSINSEIRAMTTILYVTDLAYISCLCLFYDSTFVVLGFLQYIIVICCLSLLYITAIRPVVKTYKPNDIIPFPLN